MGKKLDGDSLSYMFEKRPRGYVEPNMVLKKRIQAEIDKLTAEFLERGGEIQKVERGVTGMPEELGVEFTRRMQKPSRGE